MTALEKLRLKKILKEKLKEETIKFSYVPNDKFEAKKSRV
jgi:hypothetical protein